MPSLPRRPKRLPRRFHSGRVPGVPRHGSARFTHDFLVPSLAQNGRQVLTCRTPTPSCHPRISQSPRVSREPQRKEPSTVRGGCALCYSTRQAPPASLATTRHLYDHVLHTPRRRPNPSPPAPPGVPTRSPHQPMTPVHHHDRSHLFRSAPPPSPSPRMPHGVGGHPGPSTPEIISLGLQRPHQLYPSMAPFIWRPRSRPHRNHCSRHMTFRRLRALPRVGGGFVDCGQQVRLPLLSIIMFTIFIFSIFADAFKMYQRGVTCDPAAQCVS